MEKTKRVQILERAASLTSGDRDAIYGDPHHNLSIQTKLIAVLNRYGDHLDAGERGALVMVLAKMARILGSPRVVHDDNYVDGSCYFAIAGECAQKRRTSPDLALKAPLASIGGGG